MKTLLYKLLFVLLLLPAITNAGIGKGKYTKEKKINKSYTVNGNAGTSVANKYGSIFITTWDENRTEIDVLIKVSGNSEDDVTKRINGIDVDFSATKTLVTAKTIMENFSGRSINIEINYTIKIPKSGTLGLANQYGSIRLGKIYGDINLSCQYGDVFIDELNGDNNALKLQYCSAFKIGTCNKATITSQYSDINLTKIGTLQLGSQYSDTTIGSVDNLNYKAQYSDLTIRSADNIVGSGSYSDLSFGNVESLLNITTNYGDLSVTRLGKNVKNVSIVNTYADVKINFDAEISFDFEVNGQYSDVSGLNNFKVTEKVVKSSSSSYKGYYKSSGTGRLYIKSQYGDVSLNKL